MLCINVRHDLWQCVIWDITPDIWRICVNISLRVDQENYGLVGNHKSHKRRGKDKNSSTGSKTLADWTSKRAVAFSRESIKCPYVVSLRIHVTWRQEDRHLRGPIFAIVALTDACAQIHTLIDSVVVSLLDRETDKQTYCVRLDWIGWDWIRLDWIGLDWIGWNELRLQIRLDWSRLD